MSLPRLPLVVTLCFALVLSAACATTRQTRSAEPAGFLGDYTGLGEGRSGEAQLIYVAPLTNWSSYDAVMIDSVTLWYGDGTAKLTQKQEQQLTNYLYQSFHEQLSEEFRIADEPGHGVLRLRAALTEARGARVLGNAVTSIIPMARMPASVLGSITDVQVFVGRAGAEAEVSDSLTGRRLIAAVDERSGTKAIRSGLLEWSDVKEISDFWAKSTVERLRELGVKRKSN